MKVSKRLVVALVMGALISMGALGCNTFRGAGRDIQRGGEAIEDAADSAQIKNEDQESMEHTITAWAESGGSISPFGGTSVSHGSSQTFIATADTGFRVVDVLVDGQSVAVANYLYRDDSSWYTFTNVAANHVISASFDLIQCECQTMNVP